MTKYSEIDFINYDETNLLLGDEGLIDKDINTESWQIQDFINDMKSWGNIVPKNKKGERDLWKILHNQYEGLAQWLEFYLLHKRELRETLFSDSHLIGLKPQADLLKASHDFITMHFYPRLGFLWSDISPTEDHLWACYECSLLNQQIKHISNEKQTKTQTLNKIQNFINKNREWIDNIDWELNRKEVKENLHLSKGTDEERIQEMKYSLQILKQDDGAIMTHKLVLYQSKIYIHHYPDENFTDNFLSYMNDWEIYRKCVKNSKNYQVGYLTSDGETLQISGVGRPKKIPSNQKGRGRPKKGFKL